MTRVRLTADVEPELRRQVKIAAASSDKSVSEWIEDVLRDELQEYQDGRRVVYIGNSKVTMPPPGVKLHGRKHPKHPPKLRGAGGTIADGVIEDRDGMYLPPAGAKPKGSKNPPRFTDGSKISDAVIEDRR